MIGRTYLERGRPVVVIKQWGPGGGPRNVLIRRLDMTLVVRPFRGLRRNKIGTFPMDFGGVTRQVARHPDGQTAPMTVGHNPKQCWLQVPHLGRCWPARTAGVSGGTN